ncbi:MAG: DUF1800 domain-containing protein [Lysobacter sp.]|nr:DUF1800 domain-containing protein [Lysobacter sp.]
MSARSIGAGEAASAANRFGMGARPGELAQLRDPRDWLLAQLRIDPAAPARFAGLPASSEYLRREAQFQRERFAELCTRRQRADDASMTMEGQGRDARDDDVVEQFVSTFRKSFGADLPAELAARYRQATMTEAGFSERLVRFWSNHFAISVDKRPATLYAAPMEREAIRPHVLGNFADLLLAVETHPGMLRYLDNAQSIGEGSTFATRGARGLQRRGGNNPQPKRKLGLNENLAREILELHTLGVDGGYAQDDVTELARAITGWGTPLPRDYRDGGIAKAFVFRDIAHEPGARTLLGKRYAEGGLEQGRAMLADLAKHPSTAQHLAFKLARHFVADQPPPALVARMAKAYRDSDGHLPALYGVLIGSPEAWDTNARKFKTPDDFVVSALRATRVDGGAYPERIVGLLRQLGQPPFTPRSPAGFADTADDWSGPDALFKRVQVSQALAERVPTARLDLLQMAQDALGNGLDAETATALRRAESPQHGMALLLASPAFQWRV